MLFQFGKFWKNLFFLFVAWGSYLAFGFEFTAITILALIYGTNFKNNNIIL
jgi:hypothetical protein